MGLIGTGTNVANGKSLWDALREFCQSKPTWGTCAGMILLAEKCIGTSAVIQQGQALIGGVDITVCRNYFGSQISSFEMATPPPPRAENDDNNPNQHQAFPGVFIRAPAILAAGANVTILGRVHATPCRQAAVTLEELEQKIKNGEPILQQMSVVDAFDRSHQGGGLKYKMVANPASVDDNQDESEDSVVRLPGAAQGGTARHVICAVRKNHLLCTAFHPELTDDYRWHEYFVNEMVKKAAA